MKADDADAIRQLIELGLDRSVLKTRQPKKPRQQLDSLSQQLLVGFQGAIVTVLLQCFRDPRRLIRAIICELSIAYPIRLVRGFCAPAPSFLAGQGGCGPTVMTVDRVLR
jgi:hypothetical protein